jgi:hypothetical protein
MGEVGESAKQQCANIQRCEYHKEQAASASMVAATKQTLTNA